MTELHADPLHPLMLDPDTGVAELAGVRYLASQPVQAKDGRTVLYLTEASRPMHLFKFVGPAASSGALPHGTLYVASLGADGSGEGHGRWLPLVLARHGLSVRDGYESLQAILADPADAACRAGASRIEGLFAPQARSEGGALLLCDRATPALNWREALGDAASLSFAWHGRALVEVIDTKLHHQRIGSAAARLRG
ncbi:alkaline phosphatase PhoX [Methyloversatilis sp.]|uniref:alkaline phosphatase PhoX n=1 Tax=Methyloversatilis sp. TaxID=2569862 RepID=UPI0027363937|nr:alkaline phosphatase PhoX [Methyloversatilis sp.]MDP2869312.1 DUF839 domain-containing protein [Methyloversatilis sp.]MDP3287142.1 DUF839 domain-containing protein [Methyloversatilis sp.]MDP3456897.1 DUF839 domain-containing protein [Methyloversatilis sp.]MDP3580093.1 DUF839 domain-containing protein [Methyloversatilis sp.]